MGFLVSPGVHVKEIDLTNIIPAVQTNIGAVAGPFEKGPVATVVNIGSEEELRSIFGEKFYPQFFASEPSAPRKHVFYGFQMILRKNIFVSRKFS